METVINILLYLLSGYLSLGVLFACYFVISGAPKIDPLLKNSTHSIRILLLPGVILMWIFLVVKIIQKK